MIEWFVNTKKYVRIIIVKQRFFTQMQGNLKKQIGKPDLLVLFTNTVSHKMIQCVLSNNDTNEAELIRCHQSSGTALKKNTRIQVF